MSLKTSFGLILTIALVSSSRIAVSAQSPRRGVDTWIDRHGSVPPVYQWFRCVRTLQGKPFDKLKSQSCLSSILAHSQIRSGKLIFRHGKATDSLTFRLQSPSLTVTDVDMGVRAEQLAKTHDLLPLHPGALRVGEHYDESGEFDSWLVLDILLRSTGRRGAISRTTYLDYQQKTARVAFKIWDGPPGEPQPLPQPCKIMAGNFNLTDVDDLSPVDFVERKMKTKWLGCYSDSDVQYDANQLKEMKFLKEASIFVDGSGGFRSIAVHLRGNPISIAEVTVHGYGLLDGLRESDLPPLTIHPGDIYRRSAADAVQQLLARTLSVNERRVMVYSDVQVNESDKAELNFSVLAYPDDVVYIDGDQFDNSQSDD